MDTLLSIDTNALKDKKAYWTAKEIQQQPNVWLMAEKNIHKHQQQLSAFLEKILASENSRIILTGAGTSAYVGDAVVPHLSKTTGRFFEAISTTDLVSNPEQYLLKNKPTLLVSFARSGNSPESIAAINLADNIIDDCYHLVITCNPNGNLAVGTHNKANAFSLLMPEGTLDESFAMTSSFTSMLVSIVTIFAPDTTQLGQAANWTKKLLAQELSQIKQHASNRCNRLVVLGSGCLQGFAREAALKCLELTAGDVLSYCESPLGFRHGPKSLVNNKTDIILLSSSNAYTKAYDADLYAELIRDNAALSVTKLDHHTFNQTTPLEDVWAGLPFIVYCQILSFYKSLDLNLSPDNPCPTGEVNRVVQGVTIYPLKSP